MIRVRTARRGDAAAIGALHVESWRDAYAGILPDAVLLRMSAKVESGKWAHVLACGEAVLVAEAGDRLVGFGSCGAARGKALDYAGEVYTLYVHPDFHGQGIGRRLLRELFAALGDMGHHSAVIWVLRSNPSRYFYEAMGGKRVADRQEHLWGADLPQAAYGWQFLGVPCSAK
ncbi:MAG: GNAT family N-acetyltransferase [Alphaproteobacteria bacterium]|nr:GNAT family N-acetyltransferase [Alphaproteobacteria bacterium]